MRRVLLIVAVLASTCASVPTYPYRRCVVTRTGGHELEQAGSVLAKRETDDALLFAYDDRTAGDSGFQWIRPDDTRFVRPCKQADMTAAMYPAPEAPPWKK